MAITRLHSPKDLDRSPSIVESNRWIIDLPAVVLPQIARSRHHRVTTRCALSPAPANDVYRLTLRRSR